MGSATRITLTAVAMALAGCVPDAPDTAPDTALTAAEPTRAAVEHAEHAERPAPRIRAPRGFHAGTIGPWATVTSDDGKARILEGPVAPGAAIDAEVRRAARGEGATLVVLSEPQVIALGPAGLPASAADGRCQLGGADARIAYALIDENDGQSWLIVHISALDLDEPTHRAALEAIGAVRHPE